MRPWLRMPSAFCRGVSSWNFALFLLPPVLQAPADVFLVFGATGWIGGMMCDLLEKQGKTFVRAASRIENREDTARYGVGLGCGPRHFFFPRSRCLQPSVLPPPLTGSWTP
jgi:hypothetical protein